MSITAIVVNSLVVVCLGASFIADRKKTAAGLKFTWNMVKRMLPSILLIILIIGLILGFIPPSWISKTLGNQGGVLGVALASFLGAILFIPAVLAFPLAASLLQSGASVMSTAAFITTLTMVGFVFLPLEIKELGMRFALLRNAMSFLVAIAVAIIIGVILQ